MSTEISNNFKLKYYNKSLKKLNTYSESPIVYEFNKFSVFYICNDLSIVIFKDNCINIPGIGYLNMLICKYWIKNIPYFKLNVLEEGTNYLITNFVDNSKVKIIASTETSNLDIIDKMYEFNLNNKNKLNNLVKIDNYNFRYNFDNDLLSEYEINFLINLTSYLFKKMVELCLEKNLILNSSLFEFARYKEGKKFYLVNLPFSLDNSIFNHIKLNDYLNNDRINLFKFYKDITNTLLDKKDYDVFSYKHVNINNVITNFYLKNRNIFILIYDDNTLDILTEFTNHFNENSLFYITIKFREDIKQHIDKYRQINSNILIIVLNNNINDLYILNQLEISMLKYVEDIHKLKKYQKLQNIMCLNAIHDIVNICLEVEKVK